MIKLVAGIEYSSLSKKTLTISSKGALFNEAVTHRLLEILSHSGDQIEEVFFNQSDLFDDYDSGHTYFNRFFPGLLKCNHLSLVSFRDVNLDSKWFEDIVNCVKLSPVKNLSIDFSENNLRTEDLQIVENLKGFVSEINFSGNNIDSTQLDSDGFFVFG